MSSSRERAAQAERLSGVLGSGQCCGQLQTARRRRKLDYKSTMWNRAHGRVHTLCGVALHTKRRPQNRRGSGTVFFSCFNYGCQYVYFIPIVKMSSHLPSVSALESRRVARAVGASGGLRSHFPHWIPLLAHFLNTLPKSPACAAALSIDL